MVADGLQSRADGTLNGDGTKVTRAATGKLTKHGGLYPGLSSVGSREGEGCVGADLSVKFGQENC